MTPDEVAALFTRAGGQYLFARWRRPIAPVVFGVEERTLETVKGAVQAVAALAGHSIVETDPELGANLMVFFLRDWNELSEVPGLDGLLPELPDLLARLAEREANQYRVFRFEPDGAIRACFVFLRMDAALSEVPADSLSLSQMVQCILLWSDTAFQDQSPLARTPGGVTVLRPEIADLIRAAYDPVMPDAAADASHALRLAARLAPGLASGEGP